MAQVQQITLRVSEAGAKYVQEVMEQHGFSQSVVVRALFAVGTNHKEEAYEKMLQLSRQNDVV